jgi:hypothetical protein
MLLACFVQRELGHPFYTLSVLVLFGVTTVYFQAVAWYAASFVVLALDMLLLALLAAQRWRQQGRSGWLVLCACGTALAPGWFAGGILAGPLCCLYLLCSQRGQSPPKFQVDSPLLEQPLRGADRPREQGWLHFYVPRLLPLAGTLVFLAVSLPRTTNQILHTSHYNGRTALAAFDLWTGVCYTCRSLVDNLALGMFGISGESCPRQFLPVPLALLSLAAIWWMWPVRRRQLLALGLGLILLNYLLVYSARAAWPYDGTMVLPVWGRYHLLPHLGLALLVGAGLPYWLQNTRYRVQGPDLSREQFRILVVVLIGSFLIQLPRAAAARFGYEPEQARLLKRIEEMDVRCRVHHIDARTARQALDRLPFTLATKNDDGWELLRGSSAPLPRTTEEARRLLVENLPP